MLNAYPKTNTNSDPNTNPKPNPNHTTYQGEVLLDYHLSYTVHFILAWHHDNPNNKNGQSVTNGLRALNVGLMYSYMIPRVNAIQHAQA